MNPRLLSMLSLIGVAGAGLYLLYTPQPGDRTMLDLKDAGILECQAVGVVANEKDVSRQTANRIRRLQGDGIIRPGQRYFHMLRTGRCCGDKYLDGGFGNCVRVDGGSLGPFIEEVTEYRFTGEDGGRIWSQGIELLLEDGGVLQADRRNDGGLFERIGSIPRQAQLSIQSLRADLDGGVLVDDGGADGNGDNSVIDDAQQLAVEILHCQQIDALVDAGALRNPYSNRFCGGLNRLAVQPEPCMMPNGWGRSADGGWCEETTCFDPTGPALQRPCAAGDTCGTVDCYGIGPYGTSDGGPRWRGFNTTPREFAVGSACVPVECGVSAGDVPSEWL